MTLGFTQAREVNGRATHLNTRCTFRHPDQGTLIEPKPSELLNGHLEDTDRFLKNRTEAAAEMHAASIVDTIQASATHHADTATLLAGLLKQCMQDNQYGRA